MMKCSPMSLFRTFGKVAIAAAVIVLALPSVESNAAACLNPTKKCPAQCPQSVAEYCVNNNMRLRWTMWTNPCFACQAHYCILHRGACPSAPCKPGTCS